MQDLLGLIALLGILIEHDAIGSELPAGAFISAAVSFATFLAQAGSLRLASASGQPERCCRALS
ncbi:MAG: hypothetical protein R3F37_07730 [Candidatus Competibacteraceae bacterium]